MRSGRFAVAALTVVSITLGSAGQAHADDDDDDDDSGRATSSVEIWPPTTVQWPPLAPAQASEPGVPPVIAVP